MANDARCAPVAICGTIPGGTVVVDGIMPLDALRYQKTATSDAIKNAAGTLWTFYALRSSAPAVNAWVMIFDGAPAAANVPLEVFSLPTRGSGQGFITIPGRYPGSIQWAISTAPDVYAASAIVAVVRARYQ